MPQPTRESLISEMERASAEMLRDPVRGDAIMRFENSLQQLQERLGEGLEGGRRLWSGAVRLRDVSNALYSPRHPTLHTAHVVPLQTSLPLNPPHSTQNTLVPVHTFNAQSSAYDQLFGANSHFDSMFPLTYDTSDLDPYNFPSFLPNDPVFDTLFPNWTVDLQPMTITRTISVRPVRPRDPSAIDQRETEQARESREEEEDDGLSSMDEFSGEEDEELEGDDLGEGEEEEGVEEETEAHTEEMADCVDDEENVRTTASCPICLLEFRNDDHNRIARVLRCGHMLCTRCAEEFVKSKERENPTDPHIACRMYPCHICRKKVHWTNLPFVKEVAYLYNQVVQMQAHDPTSQIAIKDEARKILKRHHTEVEELATKMKTEAENLAALSKRARITISSSIRSTALLIEAVNNEEQIRSLEETTRADSERMETIEREFRKKSTEMAALLKSAIDPSNGSTSSE